MDMLVRPAVVQKVEAWADLKMDRTSDVMRRKLLPPCLLALGSFRTVEVPDQVHRRELMICSESRYLSADEMVEFMCGVVLS